MGITFMEVKHSTNAILVAELHKHEDVARPDERARRLLP